MRPPVDESERRRKGSTRTVETALWTATPESLQRIGLTTGAAIEDGPKAPERRSALAESLRRRLGACSEVRAEGLEAASLSAADPGSELPIVERVQVAADSLILIVQEVPLPDEDTRWVRLRARLAEKNFLRSWTPGRSGDVPEMLARALAGTGFGCHIHVSISLLDALGSGGSDRAAIASCRPSAHLAFANFVERTPGFRAESFGRVTAQRRLELAAEASAGVERRASRPEPAHLMDQRSG